MLRSPFNPLIPFRYLWNSFRALLSIISQTLAWMYSRTRFGPRAPVRAKNPGSKVLTQFAVGVRFSSLNTVPWDQRFCFFRVNTKHSPPSPLLGQKTPNTPSSKYKIHNMLNERMMGWADNNSYITKDNRHSFLKTLTSLIKTFRKFFLSPERD